MKYSIIHTERTVFIQREWTYIKTCCSERTTTIIDTSTSLWHWYQSWKSVSPMQFLVISPGDLAFTALIIGLCSSNSHWSYVRGYTHQHMTIDWEKVVYHYPFSCLSRKVQLTPFCHPWIPGSYKSGVSSILEWSILVKHGLVGVFQFPLANLCQWHMLADSIPRFTTF